MGSHVTVSADKVGGITRPWIKGGIAIHAVLDSCECILAVMALSLMIGVFIYLIFLIW